MYDGYVETPAQIQARFDRINANMEQIRIRDEMIAEVAPMLELLQSAVAGTFIVDDNGVDAVDAQRWQDGLSIDEVKRDYTFNTDNARAIALQNGQLRSYATYKNTGKAQPLTAEDVDGERLGE